MKQLKRDMSEIIGCFRRDEFEDALENLLERREPCDVFIRALEQILKTENGIGPLTSVIGAEIERIQDELKRSAKEDRWVGWAG